MIQPSADSDCTSDASAPTPMMSQEERPRTSWGMNLAHFGCLRAKPGVFGMSLALLASLCISACSEPLAPARPIRNEIPLAASVVATDSACRSLTITLVGSNGLSLTFPNRSACPSGLVLIPGGTATRSGGAKRTVNIPIRLLNRTAYSVKLPGSVVLPLDGRIVLAPSGEPSTRIVSQNPDSTRSPSNESVWLVGATGTVPIGDSTPSRTLSIRLESPVSSGLVSFQMEATLLTAAGWTLLSGSFPELDATKLIQRPGSASEIFRTDAGLRFVDGTSDATKQAFFAQNALTVLGVTSDGLFFVRFADPGLSIVAFDAYLDALRAQPEVKRVLTLFRSGFQYMEAARFPNDSMKRADWLNSSAPVGVWAMRAIRAPLAWGCETGAYSQGRVKVGLLEFTHHRLHPEFASSQPMEWIPTHPQFSQISQEGQVWRDARFQHAAATGGVLTATGDNGIGMAGVTWRTQLIQYWGATSDRRSLFPTGFYFFTDELKRSPPAVLSLSVDSNDSTMSVRDRKDWVDDYEGQLRSVLDSAPKMLIVVAAGNEKLHVAATSYDTMSAAGLVRSALIRLRLNPSYQNRIIVVAGTKPGNSFWNLNKFDGNQGSNSFAGATDIGAPAEDVGAMDTVKAGKVDYYLTQGTSVAAPMVAGTAALLLAMDSTLTPAQVKDYIMRGAQVGRNDSMTGATTAPLAVQGVPNATLYQLDVYGALTVLSKERAGTPICGYPVVGSIHGRRILLYKNGLLSAATDSIAAPPATAQNNVLVFSVAQGGRRIAINGASGKTQAITHGGTLIHTISVPRRWYLERDTVDYFSISSVANARRYRTGSATVTMPLTYADGSPVTLGLWQVIPSPDGRYFTYTAAPPATGRYGIYAKRFSDLGTEVLSECVAPCRITDDLAWSHDGRTMLTTAQVKDYIGGMPLNPYEQFITSFAVSTTSEIGAFTLKPIITLTGMVSRVNSFSGDDALVFGYTVFESGEVFVARRPAGAFGTIAGQATSPHAGWPIVFPNVRARP